MVRYVKLNDPLAKGIITHEDVEQKKLLFAHYANILTIKGNESDVSDWMHRNENMFSEVPKIYADNQAKNSKIEAISVRIADFKNAIIKAQQELDDIAGGIK